MRAGVGRDAGGLEVRDLAGHLGDVARRRAGGVRAARRPRRPGSWRSPGSGRRRPPARRWRTTTGKRREAAQVPAAHPAAADERELDALRHGLLLDLAAPLPDSLRHACRAQQVGRRSDALALAPRGWAVRSPSVVSGSAAPAVRQHARRQVEHRLVAGQEALDLVHHEAEEARPAGGRHAGDVRAQEDVGQVADRAAGRDRLGVEHVQRDADVAALAPARSARRGRRSRRARR